MRVALDEQMQGRVRAIAAALKPLQADISLPQLLALLVVALHPGLSVNELGERMGTSQQSASRYVSILMGRYTQPPGVNLDFSKRPLLTQSISAEDPRKRALYLTKFGEAMLSKLLSAFGTELGDRNYVGG